MAAPITIKRRKMTLRKPGGETAADAGTPAEDTADATVSDEPFDDETADEPFIAQQPPMPVHAKAPSYVASAIMAIFATLFFIALLIIQLAEWSDFIPHFPRPIQTGHIVNPPS